MERTKVSPPLLTHVSLTHAPIFRSGLVAVDPARKVMFLSGLYVGSSQMLPLVLRTEADVGYCFFVEHVVRHITVPMSGNSLKAMVAR